MFNRKSELFFFDVFIAILKIEQTVKRFDKAENLLYDYNAWDSVIREFEIIGEATNHLIKNNILDENSRVVVDFRNLLIHNYFGIDPEEVYDVVKSDLPAFKGLIMENLLQIDNDLKNYLIEIYSQTNNYLDFVKVALINLR